MKMTVKQFNVSLLPALAFFSLMTCADGDTPVIPEITIANSEMTFSETGGTENLYVRSNVALEVKSNDDSWCRVAPAISASAATYKYTVTADANPDTDDRFTTITVIGGDITETVGVKQAATDGFINLTDIGMERDALALAANIYAGWNIGNTLEAIGGETAWGNPKVTEDYIKKIKELGFNAIRIPCAWDQYIEDATTHKLKDSWLNRVNEVVGYCVANGLYAIVNIHWDGGWLENNCIPGKQEENNMKQKALWTQIANKLNHYDERLLFAACNEPNVDTAEKMGVLKTYEQTFIDAVRATGGNNAVRNLIVQGPNTDIDMTDHLFGDMPVDAIPNRLMVEVHYYTPWTFCGMERDETWGKAAYFWGDYRVSGSDRNATFGDEAEMKSLFTKMKTKFVDQGIPVILGEYGAITIRTGLGEHQEAHDKSRRLYDETATREAKNHGLVPFYWETGRVVNRNTGEIKDRYAMDGIIKGAQAGKYPY
jgi:aryl-phospho-beta-D-glucosidase BglC (GH1 family)